MNSKRRSLINSTSGLILVISVFALVVSAERRGQGEPREAEDYPSRVPSNIAKSASRGAVEPSYEEEQPEHQHQQPANKEKDPFYLASEYTKLMLNPVALIKKISHEFNLPKSKLIEKVGKTLVFGAEALFSPVIACIKIIEKVFVPDACRLKFVCQFGGRLGFMRETMLKLSPGFIEGSSHLKALSYGIIGRDCAQTFADCEPTLRESYKDLEEPQQDNKQEQNY